MGDNGQLLIGELGFLLNGKIFPESRAKEVDKVPQAVPRSPGHHREWIEACKGGKPAGSNFDWAGPLAETVLLGNVALRVQLREDLTLRELLWDSAAMKFTNMDEANPFLRDQYRTGWSL
jgi:hypothetical protein